jgi:hypothetical protein
MLGLKSTTTRAEREAAASQAAAAAAAAAASSSAAAVANAAESDDDSDDEIQFHRRRADAAKLQSDADAATASSSSSSSSSSASAFSSSSHKQPALPVPAHLQFAPPIVPPPPPPVTLEQLLAAGQANAEGKQFILRNLAVDAADIVRAIASRCAVLIDVFLVALCMGGEALHFLATLTPPCFAYLTTLAFNQASSRAVASNHWRRRVIVDSGSFWRRETGSLFVIVVCRGRCARTSHAAAVADTNVLVLVLALFGPTAHQSRAFHGATLPQRVDHAAAVDRAASGRRLCETSAADQDHHQLVESEPDALAQRARRLVDLFHRIGGGRGRGRCARAVAAAARVGRRRNCRAQFAVAVVVLFVAAR